MPEALKQVLESSLAEDPLCRCHFSELYDMLSTEKGAEISKIPTVKRIAASAIDDYTDSEGLESVLSFPLGDNGAGMSDYAESSSYDRKKLAAFHQRMDQEQKNSSEKKLPT